jgi:hypothetical protein
MGKRQRYTPAELEAKLRQKDEVIAELAEELLALKKRMLA